MKVKATKSRLAMLPAKSEASIRSKPMLTAKVAKSKARIE